ncbi:uncharacterized protein BT62DRAFT_919778 [Guyanagaster necrorhizus]|uniref:Nascent polypeptide-associated complex subunit alpha-like UBA domain-containing protein n=1 Tax=Guyanagaster necrorhizus TaxID=856835 RepID=A0A9P7VTN6_9AGAR|nr:uncharacterized protein BT62DRAFT_919778 [Guyanagaster necrorhizus MCA 3950]KAG7446500.1 hypothetical protein BT62DRAFT_919778 [Guyanagaster necrorhizus MCA 3950]
MSHTNGRPEPEVIMNVCPDLPSNETSLTQPTGKMDEAFRPGGILEKGPVKPVKDSSAPAIKKDDIDIIVNEFEMTRAQAEKVLVQHQGDVGAALKALITP